VLRGKYIFAFLYRAHNLFSSLAALKRNNESREFPSALDYIALASFSFLMQKAAKN